MQREQPRLGKAEAAAIALLGGGITAAAVSGVTLTAPPPAQMNYDTNTNLLLVIPQPRQS